VTLPQNGSKVPFIDRNHEVQALAADCANQSFAERIRLWNLNGRFENNQTHRRQSAIHALRVNRVSIVNHESVRLVA